MFISGRRVWQVLAVGCLAALLAAGCKTTPPEEEAPPEEVEPQGPHATLLMLFPGAQDVADWKPAGEVEIFGPTASLAEGVKAIASDTGERAALCGEYGYVKSGKRSYQRGAAGEAVTLRVFEMESPSEAFGLFSVGSRGTQFPLVGLAARMNDRALGFVKGPYFVWIEHEGAAGATSALMDLARVVAGGIASDGYRPSILESFPLGSVQGERYYLHTFDTLARLEFVPKGDPGTLARVLDLGPETDVAVMGYPTARAEVLNHVFVIRYPSAEDATAAYNGYKRYLDTSADPAEQNAIVVPPVHSYVAGTFNAEENSIRDRLADLLEGLGG